jgi:UDP-glucose 4-epimerase
MKVLVTGGAGFIGSHLCETLLSNGHEIVVVDNLTLGTIENVNSLFNNKHFVLYQCDVLDYGRMQTIFADSNFEVVFHLAANSDIDAGGKSPEIDLQNTFMTTCTVLRLMKEFNVKQIVFASTSAIYGDTGNILNEDHGPLFPISHYGAAKLASEAFISSFVASYGMQAWIIRFPNVVGERATHGVILDFINKLRKNPYELEVLGNGEQYKPYLYVKDLIDAIIYVWRNSKHPINYYNIGVDSRSKVKDIAAMVIDAMGLNAKIKYSGGDRGWIGDVPEFCYDLKKIHSLGWKAKISSDEAVQKSIRYILECS